MEGLREAGDFVKRAGRVTGAPVVTTAPAPLSICEFLFPSCQPAHGERLVRDEMGSLVVVQKNIAYLYFK